MKKLGLKETKLITALLVGYYLLMLFCGFYGPLYITFAFLIYAAVLSVLFLCYLPVGFLKKNSVFNY